MTIAPTEINRMQFNETESQIFESDVVWSVFNALQDDVLRIFQKTFFIVAAKQQTF